MIRPDNFFSDDLEDEYNYLQFNRNVSIEINYPSKKKVPKFIGKYVLGDLLGEGSYSKVKEAVDIETLERRAIKIMKKKRLRRIPLGLENVIRESNILRKLSHKNVIKLIEKIDLAEKDKLCIVMEYCVTVLQDLLDSTPNKKFPIWQAHKYFVQLLDGLEYLHGRGIVHKDIKPGNLLITLDDVVKISDFGVSEMLNSFGNEDFCFLGQGSPAFQPPEIALGEKMYHGFKVDVWASGISLYNFVTGTYPFLGENIYILFENISKGSLTIPDYLDDLLRDLLQGMLEKDDSKRFSIADSKNHCWTRKNHPKFGECIRIDGVKLNEKLRRMTVIPYLKNYHYPDRLEDEDDFDINENEENETQKDNSKKKFSEFNFRSCGQEHGAGDQFQSKDKYLNSIKWAKSLRNSLRSFPSFKKSRDFINSCETSASENFNKLTQTSCKTKKSNLSSSLRSKCTPS